MAEYIDREELKTQFMLESSLRYIKTLEDVEKIVDFVSAVDVVPVVRCKDCKYFEPKNSLETQGVCMCGEKEMNYGGEFYPFADDYCSYGERRAKHDAVRAIAENEV